jgi:cell division protein FtsX
VEEIMPKLSLVLMGIGLAIGVLGSTLSVRKFLRV